MPAQRVRAKSAKTLKRYKPPPLTGPPVYNVEVECPVCEHRAIDISDLPSEPIGMGMKCPNCRNIVHFQCARTARSVF